MKVRIIHTDATFQVADFNEDVIRIGRDPSCELSFDTDRYPKVSGLHAEFRTDGRTWKLIPCSKSNQTLLDDRPIVKAAKLVSGSRVRFGFTGPTIQIVSLGDSEVSEAVPTMMGQSSAELLCSVSDVQRFDVSQGGTIGRDKNRSEFVLDHPHVSRSHARLQVSGDTVTIIDLNSANGTYLNGQLLKFKNPLSSGDVVDIGPFSLEFDGRSLASLSRANNIQLSASGLSFAVTDSSKNSIKLLDHIDLVLNPSEFLCILGPSGSGKSTLLHQLSGRTRPTAGHVYVNARDLHDNFAALKQDLAVMPQSSVMHESLTVEETLRYTAALRLPADLNAEEMTEAVDTMLQTVGLEERRGIKIRQLSGGQLKRAGLGTELMSEPSLLFLDEVTSGLDEHSDGEMMRLFRSLADGGKTVICVTHNLAHVEENCHLLAVLTVGGCLAFYGSPHEAKKYFKVRRLAEIYTRLDSHEPRIWAQHFARTSEYYTYIAQRKPAAQAALSSNGIAIDERRNSAVRQFGVLLRRTLAVWRNDVQAIGAMLGQALLVAWLLCLVFGKFADIDETNPLARPNKIRNLLFLVCVSSYWLGCNNCVKEIVKEREIYKRERGFNLIPESYLLAKFVFLGMLGLVQTVLLGVVTLGWLDMPGERLPMLGMLAGLSLCGTTLGLAISAMAKSEETAVAFVPIVIIPQIILAGVVASLTSIPEWIAKTSITVYWGQKAIENFLPIGDRVATDFEPTTMACLGIIGCHAMAFLVVAWIGVRLTR